MKSVVRLAVVCLFVANLQSIYMQGQVLCSNSSCSQDVCYEPYDGDCTKYIQCTVVNNTYYVKRKVENCPFGQFWDNGTLTCRPSHTVDCPHDVCINTHNGFAYTMTGLGCNSFWICFNGHSISLCCPPGWSFVNSECSKIPCNDQCADA